MKASISARALVCPSPLSQRRVPSRVVHGMVIHISGLEGGQGLLEGSRE